MLPVAIGIVVGLAIGAACRLFDIPSPAPPRVIGAIILIAMTLGYVVGGEIGVRI
jgi:XapX domain-containing protein